MLAAQSLGAIPIPLYQDAAAAECVFPINNADVRFAVVEDQEQVDKLQEIQGDCPTLSRIYYDNPRGLRNYAALGLCSLDTLLQDGVALVAKNPQFVEQQIQAGQPDDVAAMFFTSGTTGNPKGCELTHRSLVDHCKNAAAEIPEIANDRQHSLIFLPMATPEIVLGASLLSLFLVFKINPGFWPTVIAHVLFCVSFVVVTVKARIASLDPRLEQAAMDLYANERETFRRVTLPLVAPGIAAAALLAFSLSFDDFIITNFNSGTMTTFPKFVYTSAARGIPAQANVIGSAMFFLALAIVIIGQFVGRRRKVS